MLAKMFPPPNEKYIIVELGIASSLTAYNPELRAIPVNSRSISFLSLGQKSQTRSSDNGHFVYHPHYVAGRVIGDVLIEAFLFQVRPINLLRTYN